MKPETKYIILNIRRKIMNQLTMIDPEQHCPRPNVTKLHSVIQCSHYAFRRYNAILSHRPGQAQQWLTVAKNAANLSAILKSVLWPTCQVTRLPRFDSYAIADLYAETECPNTTVIFEFKCTACKGIHRIMTHNKTTDKEAYYRKYLLEYGLYVDTTI